jgi:hypothetical protein
MNIKVLLRFLKDWEESTLGSFNRDTFPAEFKNPENLLIEDGHFWVDHDIDLFNCRKKIVLPDGLYINGSLDISHSVIEELPDNLTVIGNLDLYGTPINELPKNLHVGGSLTIHKTGITKLPEDLVLEGYLVMPYHKVIIHDSLSIFIRKERYENRMPMHPLKRYILK